MDAVGGVSGHARWPGGGDPAGGADKTAVDQGREDPLADAAGDRDGVLIIPQAVAEEVVTKAEQVVQTENLVRKAILEGKHPVDAYRKFGRF